MLGLTRTSKIWRRSDHWDFFLRGKGYPHHHDFYLVHLSIRSSRLFFVFMANIIPHGSKVECWEHEHASHVIYTLSRTSCYGGKQPACGVLTGRISL